MSGPRSSTAFAFGTQPGRTSGGVLWPQAAALVLASLCVLTAASQPALAAGFGIEEMSPKAIALSRAFTATADEPSAVYYNPGALARLEGFQAQGVLSLIQGQSRHDTYERAFGMSNQKLKSGFQPVPALYATYGTDLTEALHLGLGAGIMVPFGLSVDWGPGQDWGGRYTVTKAAIQAIEYNLLTIGLELELSDDFAIAIGQGNSLVASEIQLDRRIFLNSADDAKLQLRLDTGSSHVDYRYSLGGMVRLIDNKVRLGVMYRSGIDELTLEGRANVFSGPPGVFRRGGDARLTARLPGEFRAGVAIDLIGTRLTLELDYKFQNWSVLDTFELGADDPRLDGQEFVFRWRDADYFGIGVEYDVATVAEDGLGFSLRAGANYDETPIPTRVATPLLPDQDRLGFSLGFGFQPNEHVSLDVAYMGLWFRRLKKDFGGPGSSDAPVSGVGSYYNWANIVSAGVTISF